MLSPNTFFSMWLPSIIGAAPATHEIGAQETPTDRQMVPV